MLRQVLVLVASVLPIWPGAAAAGAGVAERLAALRRTVLDRDARFSVRVTLGELDEIEALTAPDSAERGRVMWLRSFVENKGGRGEDSIRHGEEALRIEGLHPFLGSEDLQTVHFGIARQAEQGERWTTAIVHYRSVLSLMAQTGASLSQQLGTRQGLAFCMHEAGDFAEARRVNQAVLDEAAALVPPDDQRLFGGRLNLAQNEYELGDLAAARTVLEGLLADAFKAGDAAMTDQSLFQLGVLAFEDGRPEEAVGLMERRLALARASGDPARVAAAADALDVLHDKLLRPRGWGGGEL